MPLPTDMTVPAVARALGCTPPTVRRLVDDRKLSAQVEWRGSRRHLRFTGSDVQAFLDTHGPYVRRAGSGGAEVAALRAEVESLRALVTGESYVTTLADGGTKDGAAERVVALEEVLLLQRAAVAANQDAEEARARATALLLDAVRELETVDAQRRTAIKALDEAIGALTVPGSVRGVE